MGPTRNVEAQRRAFRAAGTRALEAQPACLRGGELRDYQLDGVVRRSTASDVPQPPGIPMVIRGS